MELDDLKAKWQKENENYSQINKKNMDQLHSILDGKTHDLITSLKKKYEKIIGIMLGGMLIAVFMGPIMSDGFTYPGSINGYVKMMSFYLILIIFYWLRYRNVNNLQLSENINERMEQLLKIFKRNMKIEVGFVLGFFLLLLLVGRFVYGKGLENLSDKGFILSIPLAIIFTAGVIYLIVRRYKGKIKELNVYLKEYKDMI